MVKSPDERLWYIVTVRFSVGMVEAVRKQAAIDGVKPSAWIRDAVARRLAIDAYQEASNEIREATEASQGSEAPG